jgi:endonuclease/exonuclease/phosphatase (EEP) superfamily protein YafD
MNTFFALCMVWTLGPVAVFAALTFVAALFCRFDVSTALASIVAEEKGAEETVERARASARIYWLLALRAEVRDGNARKAAAFREMARQALDAVRTTPAVAMAVGLVIMLGVAGTADAKPLPAHAALSTKHAQHDIAGKVAPVAMHCETRELIQGSGSVTTCESMRSYLARIHGGGR